MPSGLSFWLLSLAYLIYYLGFRLIIILMLTLSDCQAGLSPNCVLWIFSSNFQGRIAVRLSRFLSLAFFLFLTSSAVRLLYNIRRANYCQYIFLIFFIFFLSPLFLYNSDLGTSRNIFISPPMFLICNNIYCTPIKFTVCPDCRPPAKCFADWITVNSNGLQYNCLHFLIQPAHWQAYHVIVITADLFYKSGTFSLNTISACLV